MIRTLSLTIAAAAGLGLGMPSAAVVAADGPPDTPEEAAAAFRSGVEEVLAQNPWWGGTEPGGILCYESAVLLGGWHCFAELTQDYIVTGTVGIDGAWPDTFEIFGLCGNLMGHDGDPCASLQLSSVPE